MIKSLLNYDKNISRKFIIPPEKRILRTIAAIFAHSGDSWFWVAGLFFVWLFTHGNVHAISALLAGSIVFQAIFVISIKFLIKRRRPDGDWGEIYRNTDPHSFPSGHAVRASMLAIMTWGLGLWPLNLVIALWAPLVSLARVGLGVHYLIDVIAGWILGAFLAVILLGLYPVFINLLPFAFK